MRSDLVVQWTFVLQPCVAASFSRVFPLRDAAVTKRARLQEQIKATDTKIETQRLKTVEALRRVEVLEQLEEKQRKAWKEQADKEEARLIEELTLARWVPAGLAQDR